ncbi:unnamed protein product [Cladocopium goreaui]|uniref:Uncharacterized protein n=1 Tax=Cladocopium goreaui TaxID=2562237 RepID=A0A9P1DFN1_9DINO|nr:unnamed protein product [Cladocopium goreaui]
MLHMYWSSAEPMTKEVASKGALKKADEELKEELMQRLVDSKLLGAALQVSFNHDPARLPLRELPHGSWSELFLMYKSYAGVKNEPHACRATFFKWHKNGNRAFDSTRRHNMLSVQPDFRREAEISRQLFAHFTRTWRDRQIYWLAKERARVQQDLLVVIVDSYDHAKMSLPKFPNGRTPKRSLYENTRRTFLTLTGCIVHGMGLYLYTSDEGMPGGSNWTLECVMKSIDHSWARRRASNKEMPRECLHKKLSPLFHKSGMDFRIEHIDTVRNWCQLMPTSSTLKNAYRGRKSDEETNMKVPQSFSFMCREDMPGQGHGIQTDDNVPRRLRTQGDLRDVFAMVESYMSDTVLIQPPLLVYPTAFQSSTERYFNEVNRTEHVVQQSLDSDRAADLAAIADAISKDFPHMERSVRYYRSLIDQGRPRKPYSRIGFLEAGPMVQPPMGNIQLGAEPPEPRNHWLQVIAKTNLGQHVQDVLGDPAVKKQVLQRLTIDRFENIDPKPTLTLVPQNSLAEFWLPLTAFCVGQDAKNGVGFVTSEKQAPSDLDLLGAIGQAVDVELRAAKAKPGASKALKDLLSKCITEFNKLCTIKKHRIDTARKALIYNLSLDADLGAIMRAAEEFSWERIPFILEIRGASVEEFIAQSQDRQKNAYAKSMTAAFQNWVQQLQSDQVTFESQRIMSEKESAKRRTKLIGQLEELHKRAWDLVGTYLASNLRFFAGAAKEAESTVLPLLTSYVDEAFADIPECRSTDDHGVVLWINLPCCGVVPLHKYEWCVTAVSNILALYRRNGIAFVVHANRGQVAERAGKLKVFFVDEDVKDEPDELMGLIKKDEMESGSDDEQEAAGPNQEDSDIRDMKYRLEKDLSLKERQLVIRNITWVFDKDSVYGRRDGAITGLAVIHRDRANAFKTSPGYRSGVIHDVQMLQRAQMFQPPAQQNRQNLPHLGRAFTDTQEMKQVAGGTDIVKRTLASFIPPSMHTTMILDLLAYDAFPALAALEEVASSKRMMCGSVVLNAAPGTLQTRVANALYESCRNGSAVLPNFPEYEPVVKALQENNTIDNSVGYKVCVAKCGRLLVLQSLARRWTEYEGTKDRAHELIVEHNKGFNVDGDYMEDDERP